MSVTTSIAPPDPHVACTQALVSFEAFLATNPAIDKLLGETLRTCGITLRAAAAGLFMTERPDQPELAIEHNFTALHMLPDSKPLPGTLIAVRRAAREIKPLIVPPFFIDTQSGDLPVNPSACELLFIPMKLHGKAAMVLLVAVAPTGDAQQHRIEINFLQRVLALLEATLTQRHLTLIERDRGANARLTQFAQQVHRHLLLSQVSTDIANLTRDVLAADRVTVELYPTPRKKMLAVSNVDEPDKRAALFAAQRLILEYVRDRGASVTLDRAAARQLVSDPQLQDAATAYFLAADFQTFLAAPLIADPVQPPIGVLLVEYGAGATGTIDALGATGLRSSQTRAEQDSALEKPPTHLLPQLAPIAAAAVANAIAYEAIPFRRTLAAIKAFHQKPFSTRRAAALTITAVVLAVFLALALIPADFSIRADCDVQPVSQLAIVAPLPGQIIEVPIHAGEHVYPRSYPNARPLFVFDTTDLLAERSGQQQKEAELNVELKDLQEKGDISKIGGIQLQLKQVADQLALLDHRLAQSTIYSPIEGTVLTENIEQKKWSTVQPGEPLVDVASFKDWVLVIDVPETEVATVRNALASDPAGVRIEYILYPWPDQHFEIHASGVATLLPASAQSKNANVFRLQVSINPHDLPEGIALSGVTGRAKLHVGQKPLLTQWTRGLTRLMKMTAFF